MLVIFIMLIGIVIGSRFFPAKYNHINLKLQTCCTAGLIFSMGVSLGSQPDFLGQLADIGLQSLILAVSSIVFSTAIVWTLTRKWEQRTGAVSGGETQHSSYSMVILAVCCLIAGALCGLLIFPEGLAAVIGGLSTWVLYLLMVLVGISVGLNKDAFRQVRENPARILIIPCGIAAGSIIGGILGGLILGMRLSDSVPITAAMGWYSLSGVLMTNLSGAEAGAISFLCNLIREILSFLLIPFLAKHSHYAAIAPAGATSEDTTLPMFLRYTSEEIVIMAVLNGAICSAMVPFLTPFLYRLFS